MINAPLDSGRHVQADASGVAVRAVPGTVPGVVHNATVRVSSRPVCAATLGMSAGWKATAILDANLAATDDSIGGSIRWGSYAVILTLVLEVTTSVVCTVTCGPIVGVSWGVSQTARVSLTLGQVCSVLERSREAARCRDPRRLSTDRALYCLEVGATGRASTLSSVQPAESDTAGKPLVRAGTGGAARTCHLGGGESRCHAAGNSNLRARQNRATSRRGKASESWKGRANRGFMCAVSAHCREFPLRGPKRSDQADQPGCHGGCR